jgi:hypothetical protein
VGRKPIAGRKTRDERRKDRRTGGGRPCALVKLISRRNCFWLNCQE